MKNSAVAISLLFSFLTSFSQNFITYDIDNFWTAFDKIRSASDSAQQYAYLNSLFIEPGSPGLKAMMEAKEYTAKSYIDAINNYPLFWQSVRANTLRAKDFTKHISKEIAKLKQLYPALKPADLYFTIGALRSGGTTLNGNVLIGSEIALADKNTVTTEFPAGIAEKRNAFFATNPINDVVVLNVHEYVHTQQKPIAYDLLQQCLYEGVAEFVTAIATGKPSPTPAVSFGKANEAQVKKKFEYDMYRVSKAGQWLWSDQQNEFNTRDLGYYIGYAICERYYNMAKDKKQAIREMIALDYTNDKQIQKFVDATKYFSAPLHTLYQAFETTRPKVLSITQLKNNSQAVSPGLTELTINFSESMDTHYRGFDYGPLGEQYVLRVKRFKGFSEDAKSITIEVELKPNQRYQTQITDNFRTADGRPLKPFLIDIKTAEN